MEPHAPGSAGPSNAAATSGPEKVVIVDGSNAVHAVAVAGADHARARSPRARARLVDTVRTALPGVSAVVVFDDPGPAPKAQTGGPEVVHARDADEWIVSRVEDDAAPEHVLVITSDRGLSRRVERLGARVGRPRSALGGGAPPPADQPSSSE